MKNKEKRPFLVIIPARGGSKGIPGKNIKPLDGKPLILHSLDEARKIAPDEDICVSTDDAKIKKIVEEAGVKVPFIRPAELAQDSSGTREVLLHALKFYEEKGIEYEKIILLQCTSPFRKASHIREALQLYSSELDMVVSVKESPANPYYNLFEEDECCYLRHSKGNGEYIRRQDVPKVWEYNGAVYIINPESLKKTSISSFQRVRKYEMDEKSSLDLDTPLDWLIAEAVIKDKRP